MLSARAASVSASAAVNSGESLRSCVWQPFCPRIFQTVSFTVDPAARIRRCTHLLSSLVNPLCLAALSYLTSTGIFFED